MAIGPRLLRTHSLVVERTPAGYFEDMEYVEGGEPCTKEIKCNIQPYKEKQSKITKPEGVGSEYCITVLTQDIDFQTVIQNNQTLADRFSYDGFTWVCYAAQKWRGYGLRVEHSVCLAVREDRLTEPSEVFGWQPQA